MLKKSATKSYFDLSERIKNKVKEKGTGEGGLVASEFQNKTYFGSIVLEPSKYKCGSHYHFVVSTKRQNFILTNICHLLYSKLLLMLFYSTAVKYNSASFNSLQFCPTNSMNNKIFILKVQRNKNDSCNLFHCIVRLHVIFF